jgi:hypothetical protein
MSGYSPSYSVQNPYNNSSRNKKDNNNNNNNIGNSVVANTTSSTESLLRNFIQSSTYSSTSSVLPSSVQTIYDQLIIKRDVEWTLELAQGLGRIVATHINQYQYERSKSQSTRTPSEGTTTILQLFCAAMEDWEDHLLYAVMVQDCTPSDSTSKEHKTLLELLTSIVLVIPTDQTIHRCAIIGLATAYRSLDRMDEWMVMSGINTSTFTCIVGSKTGMMDVPWWIDEKDSGQLASISFGSLYRAFCDNDDEFSLRQPSTICREQWKLSSLTMVACFLRYEILDITTTNQIIGQDQLSEVTSKLISGIQILNHSVLPPSSSEYTIPIALLSMTVLSLMQRSRNSPCDNFHSLNQTIPSTRLVENIIEFTFLASSGVTNDSTLGQVSRWILPSRRFRDGYLQSFGLHLISCWNTHDSAAFKVVTDILESKFHHYFENFWSSLFQGINPHRLEIHFHGILWIHMNNRQYARQILFSTLEKIATTESSYDNVEASMKVACKKLLISLFDIIGISSGVAYTSRLLICRFLSTLLVDRRSITANDELSRLLWDGIDSSIVQLHWEYVLEHASTEDLQQPLLLVLIDLMETLLESENCRNSLVGNMDADNVETLIYLVQPKDVRYDFSEAAHGGGLNAEGAPDLETPPLNNLSRMDDASICIEHENIKKPRGLDYSVRLSAATMLARLTFDSFLAVPDEGTRLLFSRISTAINDFLMEYHKWEEEETPSINSLDRSKRFFRLQIAMAKPDNEDYISNMIFTSRILKRKKINRMKEDHKGVRHQLEITLQREKVAQEERAALLQRLNSQAVTFQQTLSRTKANMSQEARQMVSIHAAERTKAEKMARDTMSKMEQAISELESKRAEVKELKNNAEQAQNDLASAITKIDELSLENRNLNQQVNDEKIKASELLEETRISQDELETFREQHQALQRDIHDREQVISHVLATNHQLQNNIEDLLADMCSLAQIYQHNESQSDAIERKNVEAIQEVNIKLEYERNRNEHMDEKIQGLQEENDKLFRKLAKYKERLVQERKERKQEHEQRREEEHRRKRNGPVSYLNSLHTSTLSDKSSSLHKRSSSREQASSQRPPREKSNYEKENSTSSYYTNASQRPKHY